MQLFYAVLCIGVLATSALGNCDNHCEHKGKCFTEMAKRGLKCDSNFQQRNACDHHGIADNASDDEIKKQCCMVTCYSLFTSQNLTCPVGHNGPTKNQFHQVHSHSRDPKDLQRDCCKKPKVSCYTLFTAKKFTCDKSTHFHPTKNYLNDNIHEDMTKKTEGELQGRCCQTKSVCHSKLTAKNLDCDGFGSIPSKEDTSRDSKLTAEADTNDDTLQRQCCKPNCFSIMTGKKLLCSTDTIMRAKDDGHTPSDMSDAGLQKECCRHNCHTRMKAENMTCPTGSFLKDKRDMHDPREAKGDVLIGQCCEKVECENNFCFAAMSEKNLLGSCPQYSQQRSRCDGHYPFDDNPKDRMAAMKAKSAHEIKQGCCQMGCYGMMKTKGLRCPAGHKGRGISDGHNPFGGHDAWTTKTDKEIIGGCCRKVNKCYMMLNQRNLGCDGYGRQTDEFDTWKADVDTSKLKNKTDDEVQAVCCQQTCSLAMTNKNLECDNSEQLRCESHHRPRGWKSFNQPDADLKWACCKPGPKRPKFPGCRTMLKCSGHDCHGKCPGNEKVRGDWEDPFHGARDFTKMDETALASQCCKPTCYDQVQRRGLTCPLGTKMFSKDDEHNPFQHGETGLRGASDTDVLGKCCKPVNKCYLQLKANGLSCGGFGTFPDETDDVKYDFDPLKLTKADEIKGKCCRPNCFYTMKKRSLTCKAGSPRSEHDGHNPFGSDGFAKQTDEKILEQCCSENCYSFFNAKSLTCDAGNVRGASDFHHVEFGKLAKPEDAKVECCQLTCSEALRGRNITCGDGYRPEDERRSASDWSRHNNNDMKRTCCKEISEECKRGIAKGKNRKAWVDKRPKTAGALVTYLSKWGDRVLKVKTTEETYGVAHCKIQNKKFETAEQCKAADESCCFECDKINCGGDMPQVSTCAGNEPSAFMKKFGVTECSTSGPVDVSPQTECGLCPSARDLFEQYDDNTLFSREFRDKSFGIGAARAGFHGGVNMHNVRSEVRIDDKSCAQPTAGLLVSPRNSGAFAATGKQGTVFAIVDVVNEKSTDSGSTGVVLGGAADYLLVGGRNEGTVDITTTGKVSIVGINNNKGKVNVKGGDILIGNTVNSGNVLLQGGAGNNNMVNLVNKGGGAVVVKEGTWKWHGVSNAQGGKVTIDGGVFEIDGALTRNDGTIEVKKGQVQAKVRANTGTITIEKGVTGTLLLCKQGGTINNKGTLAVTVNPDHAFCNLAVPKPTAKPALPTPKLFYCRNSAKHVKAVWKTAEESDSQKEETCGEVLQQVKTYWEAFQHELDSPNAKRLFNKCCDAKRTPPKGKRYTLIKRKIKRKIVKAKTSVNIDFTDAKNKDKKEKFERVYIKRAKAKSGTFAYKKKGKSSRRRHLSGASAGTDVTVDLEYENDTEAEAGEAAVKATDFAKDVGQDLKNEGVETTLTDTSAAIETVENEVVEEVLEDAPTTTATAAAGTTTAVAGTTAAAAGATTAAAGTTAAAAGATAAPATTATAASATTTAAPATTATAAPATTAAAPAITSTTTPSLRKTPILSSATHAMIASPFSIFFVTLIAIVTAV